MLNAGLLIAAAQLVRERPRVQEPHGAVGGLPALGAARGGGARGETRAEPEPPRPKPRLDFAAELPAPSLTAPTLSGPAVALDPAAFGLAAPVGEMTFEVADLDQPPRCGRGDAAGLSLPARQRGLEGSVTVRFLVRADGGTERISILESMPAGLFDQAVLDAVSRWRFEPGVLAGEAVASWWSRPSPSIWTV